jgi:PKHD-type hydroxylase
MIASIPPRGHQCQDQFAYWEGFLTKEDIDTLLALPHWHGSRTAEVGMPNEGVVDKGTRMTDIAWFTPCEKTRHIWEKIVNTIAQVNAQFFHFDLTGCYEPAQLGIYKADDGGHYNWHIDGMSSPLTTPRKLSMALMLSDPSEFEGGELQLITVNDDVISVEQKQGRAYFFPSYILHRVAPVTKGIRRSLVLWAGGPSFK